MWMIMDLGRSLYEKNSFIVPVLVLGSYPSFICKDSLTLAKKCSVSKQI